MIKELRDNSDFVEAALVKALISNLFTAFVEDTMGSQLNSTTDWADRIQELEKGTLIIGRAGEKPTVISSDAPGPNFDVMFQSIIKRLGMATCRGPENVSREYKASYSASQASIENASNFDDTDRQVIINRFCEPALMWLEYEAVLRGLLPVQSVDKFLANLHAYTRTEWLKPPVRPIDKPANADEVRLKNLTRCYSDIYGEMGQDWRVKLRQRAIEQAFVDGLEQEYGIDLKPEKQGTAGDEKVKPDDEE
jgi:capsid protein